MLMAEIATAMVVNRGDIGASGHFSEHDGRSSQECLDASQWTLLRSFVYRPHLEHKEFWR